MPLKRSFVAPRQILIISVLWLVLLLSGACGTLDIGIEEPGADGRPQATGERGLAVTVAATEAPGESFPVVAWYGSIHSVSGSTDGGDYLKPWHLAIWPKFGQAVGLTGANQAVDDEIERLRDRDVKATFWGEMTCGVADYGGCQLLVEWLSADDGGPPVEAERIEGWQGRVGHLPVQPGSANDQLYFVLDGRVLALYGVTSADPAIQDELERLAGETDQPGGGAGIRIWGELTSKAQPVTGTAINVDRIEPVSP